MARDHVKVRHHGAIFAGERNIIADAMSRYAYPAGKAMQDCTWHGSAQDQEEMQEIIRKELQEERTMSLWCPSAESTEEHPKGVLLIFGGRVPLEGDDVDAQVFVTTRSMSRNPQMEAESDQEAEVPKPSVPRAKTSHEPQASKTRGGTQRAGRVRTDFATPHTSFRVCVEANHRGSGRHGG